MDRSKRLGLTVAYRTHYDDGSIRAAWTTEARLGDVTDIVLIDALAARVHAAWMAEKQKQGYADHALIPAYSFVLGGPPIPDDWTPPACGSTTLYPSQACCDSPMALHHSAMRPFEDLPESRKEYDRATVRAVLAALAEGVDVP